MACRYDPTSGMVVLNKIIEPSRVTMPSLEFVTAIEFSRTIEYGLNSLSEADFPNLVKSGDDKDPYRVERENYNRKNQIDARDEQFRAVQSLINNIAKAKGFKFHFTEPDPPLPLPIGTLDVCLDFNVKDMRTPNAFSNVKNGEAATHGKINEGLFFDHFPQTEVYDKVFKSKGLTVVPIDSTTRGVIFNFCNVNVDIFPSPDYGVIDKNGNVVGFIEYKSRVTTPFEYDNIYNRDIMQTAMYALINPSRMSKVWTIQNYSNNKFFVNCYSEESVEKILNSIMYQYSIIANYVLNNTMYDNRWNVVSVPSWEFLINLRKRNTYSYQLSRSILLRYIVRDAKLRSIYKREDVEVKKASYEANEIAQGDLKLYKEEYSRRLREVRDRVQEVVKKVKAMTPSTSTGENPLLETKDSAGFLRFRYSPLDPDLEKQSNDIMVTLEVNGFTPGFGGSGNYCDPKFLQELPDTLFEDEMEALFRLFEISGRGLKG